MAIYSEDDWKAEVKILENTSDTEWERYKLEVIKTIQESKIYKPTPDGEIFNVDQNRKGAWGGMWVLDASDEELAAV